MKNSIYKLSRDYDKLFEIIKTGKIVVGFVDYDLFRDGKHPLCRDICKITRHASYNINIGVRGITYASVDSYFEEQGFEENNIFKITCECVNLEWIEA